MSFRVGRDLRIVATAKAVTLLGDTVATIALLLRLQSHGAGAAGVAGVLVANLAPIVLLTGPVGRLVDRRDNRRLLTVSGAAQAAVCTALAFAASTPTVLTLVALLGVGQAVNGATWQALVPALVAPEELSRALGFVQATTTVAGIAAPALAGVLSGAYGTRVPLLVDAATFAFISGAAALLRVRRTPSAAPGRVRGGLSIVWRHALLRPVFLLLGLFVLLGSMVNVVEVFLVRVVLHASAVWFGLNGAAYAIGLLAGALLAGRMAALRSRARGLVISAAGLSVGLVAMGLAPDVGWLMVAGVATGLANGVLNVCAWALVMGSAQAAERGRVSAVLSGMFSGTQLVAYVAGGVFAGALEPRTIFVGGGLLGLLAPLALGARVLRARIPTLATA